MGNKPSLDYYSRRDYEIRGEWVEAVRRMSAHIIGEELKIYGMRTQGIYSLPQPGGEQLQ
jgi:hypothetical protein